MHKHTTGKLLSQSLSAHSKFFGVGLVLCRCTVASQYCLAVQNTPPGNTRSSCLSECRDTNHGRIGTSAALPSNHCEVSWQLTWLVLNCRKSHSVIMVQVPHRAAHSHATNSLNQVYLLVMVTCDCCRPIASTSSCHCSHLLVQTSFVLCALCSHWADVCSHTSYHTMSGYAG